MTARTKRVTAAQELVDRVDDLTEIEVRKVLALCDGDRKEALRVTVVRNKELERANEELQRQLEAASARNEINEGIISGRYQTY
jgi:hypothetical protein